MPQPDRSPRRRTISLPAPVVIVRRPLPGLPDHDDPEDVPEVWPVVATLQPAPGSTPANVLFDWLGSDPDDGWDHWDRWAGIAEAETAIYAYDWDNHRHTVCRTTASPISEEPHTDWIAPRHRSAMGTETGHG